MVHGQFDIAHENNESEQQSQTSYQSQLSEIHLLGVQDDGFEAFERQIEIQRFIQVRKEFGENIEITESAGYRRKNGEKRDDGKESGIGQRARAHGNLVGGEAHHRQDEASQILEEEPQRLRCAGIFAATAKAAEQAYSVRLGGFDPSEPAAPCSLLRTFTHLGFILHSVS